MELKLMDASGRPVNEDAIWTPQQAAEFLGTTTTMMHRWRSHGGGPRCVRAEDNWAARYRVGDIVSWLNVRKPWTRPGGQKQRAA